MEHTLGGGVRRRLVTAIGLVAAMTVIAGAVSWFFYSRIETLLIAVIRDQTPTMVNSLKLAEASSRFANGAMAYNAARNQLERQSVAVGLDQKAHQIDDLLRALRNTAIDQTHLDLIQRLVDRLEQTLEKQNQMVQEHLALQSKVRIVRSDLEHAHDGFVAVLHEAAANADPGTVRRLWDMESAATAMVRAFAEAQQQERILALQRSRDIYDASRKTLGEAVAALPAQPLTLAMVAQVAGSLIGGAHPSASFDVLEAMIRSADALVALTRDSNTTVSELSIAVVRLVDEVERTAANTGQLAANQISDGRQSMLIIAVATFLGPVVFVWLLIGRTIVIPLTNLAKATRRIAAGELATPIPATGRDEIADLAQALAVFRDNTAALFASEEAHRQARHEAERALDELKLAHEQLASLLNNSGQGFLSFGADLVVADAYSRACIPLLGAVPAGRAVDRVLFPRAPALGQLLRDCAGDALAETDRARQSLFLGLIPSEIEVAGKRLKAEFIPTETGVMVVLSDVTKERELQRKVARETRRMEMILAAVTDGADFAATVDEFRAFAEAGATPWRDRDAADLYRAVHTFKGSFNQFGFDHLPAALHQVEASLQAEPTPAHGLNAATVVFATDWLGPLERDLETVTGALGEDFLARGGVITLSQEQARRFARLGLEVLARPELDERFRPVARELAQVRSVSLQRELSTFDHLIRQVARRRDKTVAPLVVTGCDFRLDPDTFRPFLLALGHVFRNAVDHGIEDPEIRFAIGKPEAGTITCRVSRSDHDMVLEIADDGAGIDENALRRRAVGLVSEHPNDWSLADLLFADGLSSREVATELSGRGVGLGAVRAEVVRLGGEVRVESRPAQGTAVIFRIPLAGTWEMAA